MDIDNWSWKNYVSYDCNTLQLGRLDLAQDREDEQTSNLEKPTRTKYILFLLPSVAEHASENLASKSPIN